MYSAWRELAINALLVCSKNKTFDEKTKKNVLDCIFARSGLWRRRAVPELIGVLSREKFSNFESPVSAWDVGNKSTAFELSWQVTGEHLYRSFLQGLLSQPSASGSSSLLLATDRVHVRDWTCWDAELAYAVMHSVGRMSIKVPMLSYSGIAYGCADRARKTMAPEIINVITNVRTAVEERMTSGIKERTWAIPGLTLSTDANKTVATATEPVLDESTFELCKPAADMTLRLKQDFRQPASSQCIVTWMPRRPCTPHVNRKPQPDPGTPVGIRTRVFCHEPPAARVSSFEVVPVVVVRLRFRVVPPRASVDKQRIVVPVLRTGSRRCRRGCCVLTSRLSPKSRLNLLVAVELCSCTSHVHVSGLCVKSLKSLKFRVFLGQ
jgi:hypothetical protein